MLRHACGYALANKGRETLAIQKWLRASIDHEHGDLRGHGAESVQGSLEGVRAATIF